MSTPTVYKRQLSSFDAASCAGAKHKICTCRCGGVLHGGSHKMFMAAIRIHLDSSGEISREACEALAQPAATIALLGSEGLRKLRS